MVWLKVTKGWYNNLQRDHCKNKNKIIATKIMFGEKKIYYYYLKKDEEQSEIRKLFG